MKTDLENEVEGISIESLEEIEKLAKVYLETESNIDCYSEMEIPSFIEWLRTRVKAVDLDSKLQEKEEV